VLNKISVDYWLKSIQKVQVFQPFWGRVWGYGTIKINVQGSSGGYFTKISEPFMFKKKLEQELDNLQML